MISVKISKPLIVANLFVYEKVMVFTKKNCLCRTEMIGYSVLWCTIYSVMHSQKNVTIQDIVFFVLTLNPKAFSL